MARPLTLVIMALSAVVLAAGTYWLHARAAVDALPPTEPLAVRTAPLVAADHFQRTARYAGRIEAARMTTLAFEQPGLVTEVVVEEGDEVRTGAVIARQDVRIREAERDRLEAEQAALAARIALAERTEQRQSALETRGFSATQALDEARFARASLEAEAAAVAAEIARLDVELDKAILRAPFAGAIGARSLDDGATVTAGTPVVELFETGRPEARVGVPPEVAAGLAVGAVIKLEHADRTLEARLVGKRADLDGRTRTVQLRLAVDADPPPPLGTLVALALEERVALHGFRVPVTVLQAGAKGLFNVPIVLPQGDGDWRRGYVAVEVLHTTAETAFVQGSVPAGALLVVAGAHRVANGAPVRLLDDDAS